MGTLSCLLDEDDMSSDSDTSIATQQSIKAYADKKGISGTGKSGALPKVLDQEFVAYYQIPAYDDPDPGTAEFTFTLPNSINVYAIKTILSGRMGPGFNWGVTKEWASIIYLSNDSLDTEDTDILYQLQQGGGTSNIGLITLDITAVGSSNQIKITISNGHTYAAPCHFHFRFLSGEYTGTIVKEE
jgi:hypothetical protein